jgi:transglutaminase-like putative cysteine protease
MRIRAGYRIEYQCPAPTPMLLMLSVRPERYGDLVTPQVLVTEPFAPIRQYVDGFGNVCTRVTAPAGRIAFSSGFTIEDDAQPDQTPTHAVRHPVEDLPDDVLVYLLGSRYCETDRLSDMAWSLFGQMEPGWAMAQAICDYAHDRISFGYEHSCPTRTAHGAHQEQVGVCRDYAHLAIALCRCMNIPARYCTGYLGDIGVPPMDAPMDFSAWHEVYLGGAWRTMDARHNSPRIGRILMARGRDATDVAITTSFGPADLVGFEVVTEEVGVVPVQDPSP